MTSSLRTLLSLFLVLCWPASQVWGQDGPALFEDGHFDDAAQVFEARLEENRRDAEAAYYLGRIAMEQIDYERAAEFFDRALRTDPSNPTFHYWIGAAFGLQAQDAGVLQQARLARKTRVAFERAVALDPSYIEAREALIQYHLRVPAIIGGSLSKAWEQAEAIRRIDRWRGFLAEALIHEHESALEDAERAYRDAIALHPDWTYAYTLLREFYERRGEQTRAQALMDEARSAVPGEATFWYHYARLTIDLGEALDEALGVAETFIEMVAEPEEKASGHYLIGCVWAARGDTGAAVAAWEDALALDPEHQPTLDAIESM